MKGPKVSNPSFSIILYPFFFILVADALKSIKCSAGEYVVR